jgi:hypothetical protein
LVSFIRFWDTSKLGIVARCMSHVFSYDANPLPFRWQGFT